MIPLMNTRIKPPFFRLNLRFWISTTHHGYRFLGLRCTKNFKIPRRLDSEIEIKKRTVVKLRKNQKEEYKKIAPNCHIGQPAKYSYHPSPSPSPYLSKKDDSIRRDGTHIRNILTRLPSDWHAIPPPAGGLFFLKIKRLVCNAT